MWCRWDYIFDQLNENNVKSIKAKEARDLIKKGYVGFCLPHLSHCGCQVWLLGHEKCANSKCTVLAASPGINFHVLTCRSSRFTCAASMQILVDVRPPHIFEKAHPEGAVNVPLFQRVNFRNFSVTGYLRAAALALNGVDPVEPNPKFGAVIAKVSVLTLFQKFSVTDRFVDSHCSDV